MPATFLRFRGPGQTKLDASLKASDIREQGKRRNRQNTNGPDCRGASCNRLLRIPRTEPHSRRRLLPHRANRCCKPPLLGCQGEQRVQDDRSSTETQHQAGQSMSLCVQNRRVHRRRARLQAQPDIILDTQCHRLRHRTNSDVETHGIINATW